MQGNDIEYLLKWKDGWKNTVIPSAEAKQKWPLILLRFLENHVRFHQPENRSILAFPAVENTNVTGDPIKIHCEYSVYCFHFECSINFIVIVLDVSDVRGDFEYWMEFPGKQFKFVKSNEVKENWPMLAIQYLEENLTFV